MKFLRKTWKWLLLLLIPVAYAAPVPDNYYYVRTVLQSEGQFEIVKGSDFDFSGMTEVQIAAEKTPDNQDCIGCAYYNEFELPNGKIVRVPTTQEQYNGLRDIQNYPLPSMASTTWKVLYETIRFDTPSGDLGLNEYALAYSETVTLGSKLIFPAHAAIEFTGATPSTLQTSTSGFSIMHTATGTDAILYVGVNMVDSTDGDKDVTSITFNSKQLELSQRQNVSGTGGPATEQGYLDKPDRDSSYSVTVSFAGTIDQAVMGAISLSGVDMGTALDATAGTTQSTSGTHNNLDIVTVADNAWILEVVTVSNTNNNDASALNGQTERWDVSGSASRNCNVGASLYLATAGSQALDWDSCGAVPNWAHSAASFDPCSICYLGGLSFSEKNSTTTNSVEIPTGGWPANSTILVAVSFLSETIDASVTDSQSNTYNLIDEVYIGTIDQLQVFEAHGTTALNAGDKITVTWSSSISGAHVMIVDAFSGLDTTAPHDQTASSTGTGTVADSGNTGTTAQADELIFGVGFYENDAGATYGAGGLFVKATDDGTNGGAAASNQWLISEYRIVSSTGMYNATTTSTESVDWAQHVSTFKKAAAGGGGGASPEEKQGVFWFDFD